MCAGGLVSVATSRILSSQRSRKDCSHPYAVAVPAAVIRMHVLAGGSPGLTGVDTGVIFAEADTLSQLPTMNSAMVADTR